MADRFPLIVNTTTRRIEELVAGDNIDLTGNGIIISGDVGSGKYLSSDGTTVFWNTAGDVYLDEPQILTNKTLSNATISGLNNIISNIPNTGLVNSSIIINGSSVPLGGSVVTANDNTTYSLSAEDGSNEFRKNIRLTSGGSGTVTTDEIVFVAGSNVTLTRTGDAITINSSFVDTNTVTSIRSAVGGTLVTGEVTIDATGSSTVSQVGNVITITSVDTNTITGLRTSTGDSFQSGDFTFQAAGASSISQVDKTITYSSQDTITRLGAGEVPSYQSGDITFTGSGDITVTQQGTTIDINTVNVDTITQLRGTTQGTYTSGNITITATGAATVTQNGSTINIDAVDNDTLYNVAAGGGLSILNNEFFIKNNINLSDNKIQKWDSSNAQFVNSIIEDDGSTVTIGGDLVVTGLTTTLNTETVVVADNEIELRKGVSLPGSTGGIRLNRTTDSEGLVQTFTSLNWKESSGYWRVWDGSVEKRLVTENEIQTLTNKTLTSPVLTAPTLGAAQASTINGLVITPTISSTLNINNSKTLEISGSVRFTTTQPESSVTVGIRNGGTVAYREDTLGVFQSTTSDQLRGIISDSQGIGSLVFNQNPSFTNSIRTASNAFDVFNTSVSTINAFGVATSITLGSATAGSTTIRHDLNVSKNTTLGTVVGDTLIVNASANFDTADIEIRGSSGTPMTIGRGNNAISSNTSVGYNVLSNVTTGFNNTVYGYESGYLLQDGYNNTSYGYRSLRTLSSGYQNTMIGVNSGVSVISGHKNTSVGYETLSANIDGEGNVCIGHLAGANCSGSGNVLIGAALAANSSNVTYQPPAASGDNQLVIGSGTSAWIRGDNSFNVTLPQSLVVNGNAQINGALVVNGTTTTINSSTIAVDDKNIELGSVQDTKFEGTITANSNVVTNINSTSGLIVGMEVNIINNGFSVPVGTTISSIGVNEVVLTGNANTGGAVTFEVFGPSDTTADGGGITLLGSTNKTISWFNNKNAWVLSEDLELPETATIRLLSTNIADGFNTILGPTSGSWSLGDGVTSSSLTSIGTLTSLTVSGSSDFSNDLTINNSSIKFNDSNEDHRLDITPDILNNKITSLSSGIVLLGGSSIEDGRAPRITLVNGDKIKLESSTDTGVELHYGYENVKLETTSTGVTVTGELSSNTISTGSVDFSGLLVSHDGLNGSIVNAIGELSITGGPTGSDVNIQATTGTDGVVVTTTGTSLYHSGSKKIETTSTGATVTGTLVADGVSVGNNENITIGTTGISMYHDGSNSYIKNTTGSLFITDNGNNVYIQGLDGTASGTFTGNGAVTLYYSGNQKFETSSTGVTVTGALVADGVSVGDGETITLGDASEFSIYHAADGNSIITESGGGDLFIRGTNLYLQNAAEENYFIGTSDGAATLYHNNLEKLTTSGGGIGVTGSIDLTSELNFNTPSAKYIDFYTKDATNNVFGASLRLVNHDSTSFHTGISMVRDAGVSLYYNNNEKFQTTNTGATVTGTLSASDLSITNAVSFEGINLANSKILAVGNTTAGGDLKIYHNGTDSFIEASGAGDLYIKGEDIYIQSNDNEASAYFYNNAGVELYHNAIKKFEITSTGATVTGTLITDGVTLGDDEVASFGGTSPLQISYNSTGSNGLINCENTIKVTTSQFTVKNSADNVTAIDYSESSQSVDLYFGGSKKFETTTAGVNITGDINFTGNITQNGSPLQTGGSDTFNPFLLMGA